MRSAQLFYTLYLTGSNVRTDADCEGRDDEWRIRRGGVGANGVSVERLADPTTA